MCQDNSHHHHHHHQQPDPLIPGRMVSSLPNSDHLNVAAEIKSFPSFSSPLVITFTVCANCNLIVLLMTGWRLVWSSAAVDQLLQGWTCCAFPGCYKWLFELLLPFDPPKPVWQFCSHLSFLFSGPSSANPEEDCA